VGQEHVVQTLQNAVQQDKVHHAYLFVGSRGTGKTSMAKILAACLNCEQGPTIQPCGRCDSCLAIASATSLDVIEMDAASNNSVDDIRDLREKVAYAPVSGRHKVYILDEAHMLSTQAWNAFLKTLEEPPPRTIFVLATTEAQKVLPTVVDRCHRFDFTRPSVEQVATVLRRVVEAEGIDADPAALTLIARHATGSFRDALGTLEQLLTYAGQRRIEPADVLAVLGITDSDQLFEAVDAIIARAPAQAMRTAARLGESGRDPGQVLRDLEVHARELLAVQILGEVPSELRVTPEQDERLAAQAGALASGDSVRLLDLIAQALEATSNGAQARIQLELVLVKASAPELDPSRAALLARIERLEGGRPAAAPTAPAPPATAAPAPSPPPAPAAEAPVAAAVAVAERAPASELDLQAAIDSWPAVVELVRSQNAMLAALLQDARPVDTRDHVLVLAFPAGAAFLKRKAEQDDHRRVAVEAVEAVTGHRVKLTYELRENGEAPEEAGPDTLSGEELVRRFMEEFDAKEILDDDPD
jgi:DNA polymerase-3 subunit gamma/tau